MNLFFFCFVFGSTLKTIDKIEKTGRQKEVESVAKASIPLEANKLNILDKIIAMIFQRMPILDDEETHYQTLAKKHAILKQLWMNEFGELPNE